MKELLQQTDFRIEDPTVVGIGKFDGEHRGHRKILETMKKIAEKGKLKTAVFTFQTPPSEIVSGEKKPLINTNPEKINKLRESGVDYIVEYPFSRKTAGMDAERFVLDILVGQMNMKAIVAGPDCSFGRNRSGNADLLLKLGRKYGFETVIIDKEKDHDREISSTYIREELKNGNMEMVNELLGETYSVEGEVTAGNHIGGNVLGYPTVNILPSPEKLLPRFGVYETEVQILSEGSRPVYRGITNIGVNPSVENDGLKHRVRIETFIRNFSGNLYGGRIRILFLRFIRPETKFSDMEALKKQIGEDLRS